MNVKAKRVKVSKMRGKNLELRKMLWPDLDPETLWVRTKKDGFTTIPRPMPQIIEIINHLAPQNITMTYLSLWFRVWDESLVRIKNEKDLAYESGFSSERAVSTWHSRMKILVDLGFIAAKEGSAGKYENVLVYNPYLIIKSFNEKGEIPLPLFTALFTRAQEVGADKDFK